MIRILAFVFALASAAAHGQAITRYFDKCDAGAAVGCIGGSNSADGATPSTPKADLIGQINLSTVEAGSVFRFACGARWNLGSSFFYFERSGDANLTFEPYQRPGGPTCEISDVLYALNLNDTRPRFHRDDSGTIFYCQGGSCNGNTFDGLRLTGNQTGSQAGLYIVPASSRVTVTRMDISGFYTCFAPESAVDGNPAIVHKYLHASRNRFAYCGMGILGGFSQSYLGNNLFEWNNQHTGDTSGGQQHALYFTCPAVPCIGNTISGNLFRNNSFNISTGQSYSGKYNGGNISARGQIEDTVFDGNDFINTQAGGATLRSYCYSLGNGYAPTSPAGWGTEWWRRMTIRNSTMSGCGIGIGITAATDALIENNRYIVTPEQASDVSIGLRLPHRDHDSVNNDDFDARLRLADFTCVFLASPAYGSTCVQTTDNSTNTMGTGVELVNIHAHFVSNTNNAYAFWLKDAPASYGRIQGLAVTGPNRVWDAGYTTLSGFNTRFSNRPSGAVAGAVDTADPLFSTTPAAGNGYACALLASSPLAGTGATAGAVVGYDGKTFTLPSIGACDP